MCSSSVHPSFYGFNSFTGEGSESSSHLQISNEYDKLFLGDWFPSPYSSESHVKSGMDFSSSSLPLPPFPLASNSNPYSVGEGEDGSVKTMGLNNGEVQFNGSQAVTVTGAAKKTQRLGPKIIALQRLISPYGKTDAASVLNETANNIRYLHEQIKALTSMGCDLHSIGLCLVPVSPELVNLTSQLNRNVPGNTVSFSRFRI
ncbi:Transcription factor bHLH123 [Carex littledalei]|uniref:Transcription factor bHLH123 n=1 Tax=Carex littledalei TaxID=544730 RepID=A0A833VR25_9POAL|nr:Transcription factor bHLH123 [Carex littledalei]